MNMKQLLIVFTAGLLSAVSTLSADPAPVALTNWQRVDFGGLSFRVPPGMTNVPVRGIDSLVGRWDGTNISLHLDFGPYARMTFGTGASTVKVAGRAGKMITTARDVGPTSGGRASFTNVTEVGVPDGPWGQYLRMTFYHNAPTEVPLLRAIIDSVHY